jgi:hypothetical protein
MLRSKHAVERVTHLGVIIDDKNMGSSERLGHDEMRKVNREYRKAGFIPSGAPFGQLSFGQAGGISPKIMPRNFKSFALNIMIN